MKHGTTMAAIGSALALLLAACGGGDGGDTGDAGDSGATTISVMGTDDLKFDQTSLTAAAGEITVELSCGESVNHDFTVEGEQGDEPVAECEPGGSGSGTIQLDAGDYTFYCSVEGHRSAGMEGTLTVEG